MRRIDSYFTPSVMKTPCAPYSALHRTLPTSWKAVLDVAFESKEYKKIIEELEKEEASGRTIYPPKRLTFRAFELTDFNDVKVVILGQDPYHQPGQAEGLCFSVPNGTKVPSSLRNIFKELGGRQESSLVDWANQGVLLLNTGLTVRANEANSHRKFGWEWFTDFVITKLNSEKRGVIFVLWGKQAQLKEKLIDQNQHYILKCAHPSGLSAYRGFIGCGHFDKVNSILTENGQESIQWK